MEFEKRSLKNISPGGWLVQKFGGTSVGKFPDKIAQDIVRAYLPSHKIVVVCSARSTGKKATGTTSRLLEIFRRLRAMDHAVSDEYLRKKLLGECRQVAQDICDDHVAAAEQFVHEPGLRAAVKAEMTTECQTLMEYVEVAQRFKLEINSRSKDRVVSYGERLSCRFMASVLRDRGVEAEYVDLCEVLYTDSAERLDAKFYREATACIWSKLARCGDRVPIVTGFFGKVPGGLLDGDIGRGYTDLCAGLVAVGLAAQELQIWKEVDGIFTADPAKVPTARLIPSITPSEAAELTFYGSEVIHHMTIDLVIKAQPPIPTRIKNVNNPRGEGTIVNPDRALAPGQQLKRWRNPFMIRIKPKRPTALTIKNDISIINIHSNKRSIAHGFFARVFRILNQHRISVDLISTSEVHVSMAVHNPHLAPTNISATNSIAGSAAPSPIDLDNFESAIANLRDCGNVSVLHEMAILSLVGAEMKNMTGIAGKMFSTLGEHQINLEMISQGASEINISCVIDKRDAERAMNILHTNLFTFLD